jgi:hypothetical protein
MNFVCGNPPDTNKFISFYVTEVLKELDVHKIAKEVDGRILLGHVDKGFCHRHIVAKWLIKHGYEVEEL